MQTLTGNRRKLVIVWLVVTMMMIFSTIIVGGLTRLTESGLSMVDWQPILGVFPPSSESEWMSRFNDYRQFPEYQKINKGMSLDEFKVIFYWEYGHRILGRLIGFVYAVPFLIFWLLGFFDRLLSRRLFIALILGGGQGVLGWFMVQSGLVNEPRVSHYRLAAHFSLAVFLMMYLYWIVLRIWPRSKASYITAYPGEGKIRIFARFLLALVAIQMIYGAMTAGLDAGLVYNSFPDWNGRLIPAGLSSLQPFIVNFVENPVGVQFVHRSIGWLVLLATLTYLFIVWRNHQGRRLRTAALLFSLAVGAQFTLGILTLIWFVPISVASMHQGGAVIMLLLLIWNVFLTSRKHSKQPHQLSENVTAQA